MNIVRFWIRNARSRALPQSFLPAILAFCLASPEKGFSVYLGIIAIAGVIAGHLCMNLFDDYFDYRVKGAEFRDVLARKGFRSRIAKCAYITSGKADLKQLLIACFAFGAIALGMGGIIFFFRGNTILWFALVTAVLGISYSGWPLRLSYHGLGEIVIGIMFGPLLMMGVYYSACGQLDWPVIFISVPVGLLVSNIVYTHAIMDYEPDKEAGKMTFAVLLQTQKRMLAVLFFLLLAAFSCIVAGVILGYLSPFYLLTLLALPMAAGLFYLMIEFVRHPEKKFSPQCWMGPAGDWKRIQSSGLDWFMIRWLLARNLLSFFCLINIGVCLIQ
ncbi:MAG: prenyltransferase [Dysgonamonadaceae bacterium]|jgi:1,4-dihydroxy-2-naphthoate octaprenyltransferase|nr:prenyltransferase [Dysgonamonadaceae bacterium]